MYDKCNFTPNGFFETYMEGNRLDIQTIANLYVVFLLVAALISSILGFFITKKLKNYKKGFISLLICSGILIIIIIKWFDTASRSVYMGTLPWLFNIVLAIILYLVYLVIAWFTLKRISKKFIEH